MCTINAQKHSLLGHSVQNQTKLNEVSTTPSLIFMIFILQVDIHEVNFSQSFNFCYH
jgi:hypothetical protein